MPRRPPVFAGWLVHHPYNRVGGVRHGIDEGPPLGQREGVTTDRYRFCRAALVAGAALLGLVAVTIVTGVIPPVSADVFPLANPGRAVIAFLINVLFCLLVAASMYGEIRRMAVPARPRPTATLVLDAIVVLVLGLSLIDAASAFRAHGVALQGASHLLLASAGADGLVLLLLLAVIALFPKPLPASRSE
jgi:hypothetical protein